MTRHTSAEDTHSGTLRGGRHCFASAALQSNTASNRCSPLPARFGVSQPAPNPRSWLFQCCCALSSADVDTGARGVAALPDAPPPPRRRRRRSTIRSRAKIDATLDSTIAQSLASVGAVLDNSTPMPALTGTQQLQLAAAPAVATNDPYMVSEQPAAAPVVPPTLEAVPPLQTPAPL